MKQKSRATRLSNACSKIAEGIAEIEELKDEIVSWKEGMEGTNLEQTAKYSELEECADQLENAVSELDSSNNELEGVEFPGMY